MTAISTEEYAAFIAKTVQVCERAANGDLESRLLHLPVEGDLRLLGLAINHLLDVTDAFVREAAASLEHAAHGQFHRRFLQRGMPGAFRSGARIIGSATAVMEANQRKLETSEARRVELASQLEDVVNGVVKAVAASAEQMRATAEGLAAVVEDTAREAATVSTAAGEASESVQLAAAATEQLTASFQEIERRSDESSRLAMVAAEEARRSTEGIGRLQEASGRMGKVVNLISQIARQTNLLALNATIEAARSGEAGRGFAVVAGEVKSLARQTASATTDIGQEIERMLGAAREAVSTLEAVSGNVHRMTDVSSGIAGAINEQRVAAAEINKGIHRAATGARCVSDSLKSVTDATAKSGASAAKLMDAAEALTQQAESLRTSTAGLLEEIRA